ncbi:hypothetical protein HP550_06715 [Cellulomonas humilata]|uniref:Uncharacterized protein n=1 Tax=Cellulomonas humilata TaxID=144055 RepID=A0A7Y6DVY2_9CELL|nr:hypothetical protein [Cellulomonas humilata]NUU16941.1 hypothetical protein [Cellulomonas humilata]
MKLEFPDRREDVLAALECLAGEPPHLSGTDVDPRWPDVRNAIHWLIDDTWWDTTDPSESIGGTLCDEREAAAVSRVVEAVLAVARRRQPDDVDSLWFGDTSWPLVRTSAGEALDVLRTGDRT